mmetsp:Transcript_8046/g.7990  ORF Transcript_8046/g.7990 Transcript_8046/m.7990 type:complete len:157 (-) Transcript_8046:278-748(-)
MSFLKDLIESAFPVAYAEEPAEEEPIEEEESTQESEGDEKESSDDAEESEDKESGDAEEGDDEDEDEDEDEDDEDEDEEDEETVDPLDSLREECTNTQTCKPYLHHFEECIERVTKEQEEEGYEHKAYKEDCVEEFFHLQHCVNDCVSPRLFHKLK